MRIRGGVFLRWLWLCCMCWLQSLAMAAAPVVDATQMGA